MNNDNNNYNNEQQEQEQQNRNIVIKNMKITRKFNSAKKSAKALMIAGKTVMFIGKVVEGMGRVVRSSGKGLKFLGKKQYQLGKALFNTGKAAFTIPIAGPIIGIPLCILGILNMVVGKLIEFTGLVIENIGKLIEFLGNKIQSFAQIILNKANKKLQEIGSKPVDVKTGEPPAINKEQNRTSTGGIPSFGEFIKKNLLNSSILIVLIPLLIVIAVLIVLGVIDGETTINQGGYVADDYTNVPYVVSTMVKDNLVIVSDGSGSYSYAFENSEGQIIDIDQSVSVALETLNDNDSESVNYLGKNNDERKAVLKKMILAEIATQYPDLSTSEDLNLATNVSEATVFTESQVVVGSETETETQTDNEDTALSTSVTDILNSMTLDEKIQQLFMVQSTVSSGDFANTSYGGIIANNGKGTDYSACTGIGTNSKIKPFVATDDEGGSVYRAYTNSDGARSYGDSKDYEKIYNDEITKSNTLLNLGITLNLGPVTDVISDTNGALYNRSYSGDASTVEECIKQVISARSTTNINNISMSSSLKHYPGYLNTQTNTDKGIGICDSSIEEINENIDVFLAGIDAGAESVMVSNVIYSNLDADNPATLSSIIISQLRSNFNGVIMTDDIGSTGALTNYPNRYTQAILAGNDVLLMGINNADEALNQIKQAVENGTITEERINESVLRVLNWKSEAGVLNASSSTTGSFSTSGNVQISAISTGDIKIDTPIEEDKKIQGGIKIQRKSENGTTIDLKYTSTQNFNALLASKSDDIMNYYTLQKNVQTSSANVSGTGATGVVLEGTETADQIWNFLKNDMGYNDAVAAGILGNIMVEAGGQSLNINPYEENLIGNRSLWNSAMG